MKNASVRCGKRYGHALPTQHIGLLRIERLEARTLLSGWGTSDDFPLAPGGYADYQGAVSDGAGNVYVAGEAYDAAGVQHDILRMKAAGSTTWSTLSDAVGAESYGDLAVNSAGDLFVSGGSTVMRMRRSLGETSFSVIGQFASASQRLHPNNLAFDASGNLYVSVWGQVRGGGGSGSWGNDRWFIFKGSARGAFQAVDDFSYAHSSHTIVQDMTVVSSGLSVQIYAIGWAGTGYWTDDHLLVRKSPDGGESWQLVDDYKYDPVSGGGAEGRTIVADGAGNIYVAGTGAKGTLSGTSKKPTYTFSTDLVLRRSSNGGATWLYVDTQSKVWPEDLAVDTAGNILLAASASISGSSHFVIRSNEGGTWHNAEDYQLAAGQSATPYAIAVAPGGDVFVAGTAADSTDSQHAIVLSFSQAPAATSSAFSGGGVAPSSHNGATSSRLIPRLVR